MSPTYADTLTTAEGRGILTLRRGFPHPPRAVWAALTTAEALSQWFPFQVDLDLRPGGTLTFRAPVGGARLSTGSVTEVDEPRLFAFDWASDHFRWTVEPDGPGATLTLVQTFDDLAGAPSFAAGWHQCTAALAQLLGGGPVRREPPTAELHDAYVRLFGLDRGTVTEGGRGIRFERQLVRPAEKVWETLSAGLEPVPGLPVPAGFTARGVPAGHVTEVHPPHALAYAWSDDGTVTWELREGTGFGARLVLVQTGGADFDPGAALDAWGTRLEALSASLREG